MPRWHGESTQRSGCISSPPSCYMDPRLMPHNSSTMVSGVPGFLVPSQIHVTVQCARAQDSLLPSIIPSAPSSGQH
ncbi:hypothetical protein GOODEAATRI_029971 [Goodea atripinnis]|uniref:Uncharacterized protein n=1 Tax=Goodea atripinnis TaxID=208336 RepID=A0ABV0P8W9_9TELE